MKRRKLALGALGAGAAAVVGGAFMAVRRPGQVDLEAPAAPVDLWTLEFPTPDGSTLRLIDRRGRPLLVNFWATWCGPCVTEMPLLDRFAAEQRPNDGVRVVALAVDEADPVRRFIAERTLRLDVGLAGADGMALSRALGNNRTGLPFSVMFDRGGRAFASKLGEVSPELLQLWALTATN